MFAVMWYTQNMTDSFDFLKTENIGKYKEFYDFLILNNKKFNLTSIVDYEEFLIKHVVDSLSCKNIIICLIKIKGQDELDKSLALDFKFEVFVSLLGYLFFFYFHR